VVRMSNIQMIVIILLHFAMLVFSFWIAAASSLKKAIIRSLCAGPMMIVPAFFILIHLAKNSLIDNAGDMLYQLLFLGLYIPVFQIIVKRHARQK